MNPSPETSAVAARDAYLDRPKSDIDAETKKVSLDAHPYQVFAYTADAKTGFHATAYQNTDAPYNIIITCRGTDSDVLHHPRTTAQDVVVDLEMVKDQTNRQKHAADVFIQDVLDKAQKAGIARDQITLAGHSLGGALVEIEAHQFGLRGVTVNGYGAVDLGYGVPEGGDQVVNYVMASDVVSAASRHFGQVRGLADDKDIQALTAGRYLNAAPDSPPPNPLLVLADNPGAHASTHFAPKPGSSQDSVLRPEVLAKYEQNYENHKAAIDHFRGDIYRERHDLVEVLRNPDSHNLTSTFSHLPPYIQQQMAELQTLKVDAPIQDAIEHNRVVEGAKLGLDQADVALRAGGHGMQQSADQTAHDLRAVGHRAEQQTDDLSRRVQAVAPIDPLIVGGVALGVKAAGYLARTETERYAQVSQLAGQASNATGQFMADQTQTAKHTLERSMHTTSQVAQGLVHGTETMVVAGADAIIDTGHVIGAVSRGLDAISQPATPPRLHQDGPHMAIPPPSFDGVTMRTLQAHLNTLGLTDHRGQPLAESGVYDSPTRMAVMGFQHEHGLPTTGLPDKATLSLLEAHATLAALHKPTAALDLASIQATRPGQIPEARHADLSRHPSTTARIDTPQASGMRPFSDPSHPQHALYRELKERLPSNACEARLAQLTVACHQGNIKPGQIESITLENKHAVIVGLAGYANVDMNQSSPPLQQSLQQAEALNQQQSQQQTLRAPQHVQGQSGPGLSHSLH